MGKTDGSIAQRMMGAATLDIDTYEEVEHDQSATMQAAAVVVLVALCRTAGAWDLGLLSVSRIALIELATWFTWAGVTYVVGGKLFQGEATMSTSSTWDGASMTQEELMQKDLVTLPVKSTIAEAAEALSEGTFHALPVVDGGGDLEGLVTSTDLIRYLRSLF